MIHFNGSTFTKTASAEPPYGIAITTPQKMLDEYPGGVAEFEKEMEYLAEHPDILWHHTLGNLPTQEVGFAYFVYAGRVQWKLAIVDYQRNVTHDFSKGGVIRSFENKNWVRLCCPVKAPGDFFMRGFRGFRYTSFIF